MCSLNKFDVPKRDETETLETSLSLELMGTNFFWEVYVIRETMIKNRKMIINDLEQWTVMIKDFKQLKTMINNF